MLSRLKHLEPVLTAREWLTANFSIADILMADVLRLVDKVRWLGGISCLAFAYVAHAIARPCFVKAHADQMKHFAEQDAATGRE